jgi:hypothetical protein
VLLLGFPIGFIAINYRESLKSVIISVSMFNQ